MVIIVIVSISTIMRTAIQKFTCNWLRPLQIEPLGDRTGPSPPEQQEGLTK